ncbi:hypothetical protein P43SY_000428 [Pythium insidiosum]|uniref:AB hydrolase-1 domain-containing protein n=1 Tax=Pythium insidiosum TaxID=114742 RepID=A0AAD5LJ37_PYTIN|nr:hypothetical protein P43SY_000428 [Pythium insidiosum]
MDFASRLPFKLAEAWLADASRNVALLTFNFAGVLGSDDALRFADKLLSLEVEDAVAVCRFVRSSLLDADVGRVHVVGLSTGAIIASLLRDRGVADTISVIAGLADLPKGIHYDFSDEQIAQMQRLGYCWKEFYLPEEIPALTTLRTPVSLDGERAATLDELETASERKIFLQLHRAYFDECKGGSLDIRQAVSRSGVTPWPPLLVIHGDADQNVPVADGEELYRVASEPKSFLVVPKGNHLLTNTKLLKKALRAILEHAGGRDGQ